MSGMEVAVPYLLGAAGGSILTQVMAKPKASAAPAPAVEAPKTMPLPDDEVVKQAKRRAIARTAAGSSRMNNILSDSYSGTGSTTSDTLG